MLVSNALDAISAYIMWTLRFVFSLNSSHTIFRSDTTNFRNKLNRIGDIKQPCFHSEPLCKLTISDDCMFNIIMHSFSW